MQKVERKPTEWWKSRTLDDRIEDARMAEICDTNAERTAEKANARQRYGRWYVSGKNLITPIYMQDGNMYGTYDIPLSDINTDWVAHFLFTKDWCGMRGLIDLAEALCELRQK